MKAKKSQITKSLAVFMTFLALSILSTKIAFSYEGNLSVSPAKIELALLPGETKIITFKFYNQAKIPVSGTFGVSDFIVTDKSGTPTLLDPASTSVNPYQAATWVKLALESGVVAPLDGVKVPLTINVPNNAKAGGRYIGIYFQPKYDSESQNSPHNRIGSEIQTKLTALIYLRVSGPITESAVISKFSTSKFIEYGPANITTEILNKGSYHIKPAGTIELYDLLGRRIDASAFEEENIFPDATRKYENTLGTKYLIGKFKVKLALFYGEKNQTLYAETTFWAFPLKLMLITALTVILLFLLLTSLTKKDKERKTKIEQILPGSIEYLKEKYKDIISS